jgi:beta-galactosidase
MVCSESFPKEAFEYWAQVEKYPYVIGDFVWTGLDYLGESGIGRSYIKGQEPGQSLGAWPWHIAGCGDLDLLGRRKPWSYYREALWQPGVLRIAVHAPLAPGQEETITMWGWSDVRSHWTWPGHEGKPLKVDVYSSCDQVVLSLNGRVIGEKATTRAERNLASFEVPYEAGELKAVGTINGRKVEYLLRSAGAPVALKLIPDRTQIAASREDLSFVEIQVVDARGTVVPQSQAPVRLIVSGAGELAAVGNANPVDTASFRGPVRKAWNGTLQAILRPTGKPGTITLRAEAEGLKGATLAVKAK